MKYKCKCGEEYDSAVHLRMHIGLLTPRWPAQPCTPDHYDPSKQEHVDYVARYIPDNRDRRFT